MMSDDRHHGGGGDDVQDGGPGEVYMAFVVMEELTDKLRLLNYDDQFLRKMNVKPISKCIDNILQEHFFAIATNPGEQFYIFASMAAWLLRVSGRDFEQPQEYDDPNATISCILEEVKKFGHAVGFPPSKLKPGWGEHCIYVLDRLADEALVNTGFKWNRPLYPEEVAEEENFVDDDSELNLQEIEKTMSLAGHYDSDGKDDDEPMLDLNDAKSAVLSKRPVAEEIMQSTTDASDWRLEVERVTPHLKVSIRPDVRDWRIHLDQMHQHRDGISSSLTDTTLHLDKLHDEISHTLEKVASREKYLNSQLEHLLSAFRLAQDRLAESRERYRLASGGVTERSRSLAELTDDLERLKQEMEEWGNSMTDGAPLVKVKQVCQQLRKEITEMDIRSGVAQHVLLQAQLKAKTGQSGQADDTFLI